MNGERETSELASFHPKPYGCTAWPARSAPPPPGGSSRRSHGEEDSCWVMAMPGYAVNHSPPVFGSVCVCVMRVCACVSGACVRACMCERERVSSRSFIEPHLKRLTEPGWFFLSYFDVLLWMTLRFFFFFEFLFVFLNIYLGASLSYHFITEL